MARETTYGAGTPRTDRSGARRVEGPSSGGLRKLVPLLLALLLAVLLAVLLISLIGGDDDNSSSDAGQLTAGNAQLLPPPAGGLSAQVGETATGKDALVQSVNGNEGFFVGSSTKDRVYVEWGGDIGENEASRFQPQKGDAVNLTGPLQAVGPAQLRKLKLSEADARLVRSQGAFVNADRVREAN
ncbi:MAG TPA: hypothetical protein VE270_06955 [Thermoleophilaceae bacterium]|nr:hypothetical protein [Thermoleophilaceae bacterium]